jgi:PKD repeat protein
VPGWLPLFAPAFPATFLGNPDANITALDTSGGIVSFWDSASTSPRVPCLYMVSASEMLATGTTRPYEDLHFAWNFGDASGTETFTRPTDGVTVNANSEQTGPEAAYCYRTAGSYTITLTVAGAGGNVVAQKTKSVTIGAFTPSVTYYCDSNVVGGTADGSSQANAFPNLAALTAVISPNSSNTFTNILILLAKGSVFTEGIGFNIANSEGNDYSGIRIQSYGSGSKPIINNATDLRAGAHFAHGLKINCYSTPGRSFYDLVVDGIEFQQTNVTISPLSIVCDSRGAASDPNLSVMENVYFVDCPIDLTADISGAQVVVNYNGKTKDRGSKGGGFWNCSITNPDAATHHGSGVSGSPQEWFLMVGCTVSGKGQNNFDHHVYPDCADHELYKWCTFGKDGVSSNRGMCVNMNWDWELASVSPPGVVLPALYRVVSECVTQGTDSSIDAGNRTNNTLSTDNIVQFSGLVIERNLMRQHDSTHLMQLPCATEFTIRGNRTMANVGSLFSPPNTAFYSGSSTPANLQAMEVMEGKIYENRILISPGSNNQAAINLNDDGFTLAQQWTRNTIKDYRSGTLGPCLKFDFASMITAGIVIDLNTLYSVNGASQIVNDVTAGDKTYSAYRTGTGFDPNGANTDPGWLSTASEWSDLD